MAFDPSTATAVDEAPGAPKGFDPTSAKPVEAPETPLGDVDTESQDDAQAFHWANLYGGLDGLDDRLHAKQKTAFAQLDKTTDDPKETRAAAINQSFLTEDLSPMMHPDAISSNWPAVKDAWAKEKLGIDQQGISDVSLYGKISSEIKKEVSAVQQDPWTLIPGLTRNRAEAFWQSLNTPFKELPDAPANLPEDVMTTPDGLQISPAVVGGVWNGIKPYVQGLETPLGIGTLGVGAELKVLSEAYPAAHAALLGIEGGFTGQMAKATTEAAPETKRILEDPNATTEQKVAAITNPVASGIATLLGSLGLAFEALPDAPAVAKAMEGKTPTESAEILRTEAAKVPDPHQEDALNQAATDLEDVGKHVPDIRPGGGGFGGTAEPIPNEHPRSSIVPQEAAAAITDARVVGSTIYLRFDENSPMSAAVLDKAIKDAGLQGDVQEFQRGPMNAVNGKQSLQIHATDGGRSSSKSAQAIFEALGFDSEFHGQSDLQKIRTAPSEKFLQGLEGTETPDQKGPIAKAADEAQKLGAVAPGMDRVADFARDAGEQIKQVTNFIRNAPDATGFGKILREWTGAQQMDAIKLAPVLDRVKEIAPDRVTREGIANWLDAGGDEAALKQRLEATTDSKLRKGYEAALSLKPEELQLANQIRTWFNDNFQRAKDAGIMGDERFRENYVTQLIDKPFVGGGTASEFYGKLNKNFQFSEERTFPNFAELEQAGFKVKSKDIGEIMAWYDTALSKAINTREMVDSMEKAKTPMGEPLAVRGQLPEGVESTYERIDHPSLRGVQFHPDVASHLRNVLGQSAIRDWYDQPGSPLQQLGKRGVKFVDEANRYFANTMLGGISSFHAVHEAKRGATYGINLFNLDHVTEKDPMVEKAVKSGLMLVHDSNAIAEFTEGTGGHKSGIDLIPGVRNVSKVVSDFTFKKLIPELKLTTWRVLRDRNSSWFSQELKDGKITQDQIDYLTSQQVNARYGHLNMADIGRNPTIQHLFRFAALAPDFWEANLRNYGQQLKGLTLSKAGAEPLKGFLVTAASLYTAARVINMAANDDHDPHFEEPFKIVHGDRTYAIRNEVQDAVNMWKGVQQTVQRGGRNSYIAGRMSPMAALGVNLISGSNWRGEKIPPATAFRDYAASIAPISLRWTPGVSHLLKDISPSERTQDVSVFEQFLQSQGIQIARKSAINEAYGFANDWKRSAGKPEDSGVYPVSQYQPIRYALEDNDDAKVTAEIEKQAPKDEAATKKLSKSVHSSLLHAWTGSEKDDETFFQSLPKEDQIKVLKAQFAREAMVGRFDQLLEKYSDAHDLGFEATEYQPPKKDPYEDARP